MPVSGDEWRYFRRPDRVTQLTNLEGACRHAAVALDVVGDRVAPAYAAFGEDVAEVLSADFDQADLTELSTRVPPLPERLHPKTLDHGVPLPPEWQTVDEWVKRVHALALDLRTLANAEGDRS